MVDLPPYDTMLAQAREIAAEVTPASNATASRPDLRMRNTVVIGGSMALLALYGSQKWWDDGFSGGFKAESEGWFGKGTEFGGVDKLGHAYSGYVGVRLLTPMLAAIGNDAESARKLAAWSTFGAMTAIEVIDGYSKRYKFGREDFVANTVGIAAAYALEAWPEVDEAIDFRFAYKQSPHSSEWDAFGDYSGQRYLVVAKAEAVPALRDNVLTRYLEVSFGYGTRGYDADPSSGYPKSRDLYFGVGINLSRLLADGFYGGQRSSTRTQRVAERFFELVQLPVAAYSRKELDK